jgi:predicted nucleotidyltransferase component of viral defense system
VAEARPPRESDVASWHADLGGASREAATRDLLLARVAVAVASHPALRDELVLRGGLALHRLVLSAPLRACVALEYTRRGTSGIGAVLDALRDAASEVGFAVRTEVRHLPRAYLTPAWSGAPARLRLRVDLETRETEPWSPPVRRQLTTSGDVDGPTVLTYDTAELLGLLLRELYRRSRSRDLFDLWVALERCGVDDTAVLAAFRHACRLAGLGRIPRGTFVARLHRHRARPAFTRDLEGLVGAGARDFEPTVASALVTRRLLDRLPG